MEKIFDRVTPQGKGTLELGDFLKGKIFLQADEKTSGNLIDGNIVHVPRLQSGTTRLERIDGENYIVHHMWNYTKQAFGNMKISNVKNPKKLYLVSENKILYTEEYPNLLEEKICGYSLPDRNVEKLIGDYLQFNCFIGEPILGFLGRDEWEIYLSYDGPELIDIPQVSYDVWGFSEETREKLLNNSVYSEKYGILYDNMADLHRKKLRGKFPEGIFLSDIISQHISQSYDVVVKSTENQLSLPSREGFIISNIKTSKLLAEYIVQFNAYTIRASAILSSESEIRVVSHTSGSLWTVSYTMNKIDPEYWESIKEREIIGISEGLAYIFSKGDMKLEQLM